MERNGITSVGNEMLLLKSQLSPFYRSVIPYVFFFLALFYYILVEKYNNYVQIHFAKNSSVLIVPKRRVPVRAKIKI
ncbi:hypothetical protein BC943DRAFT_317589 [Umbelopsis sp. AD052]|nr:hypothetical protein BC943DRAFT_317589 [Umbelopsis sp. AD052]